MDVRKNSHRRVWNHNLAGTDSSTEEGVHSPCAGPTSGVHCPHSIGRWHTAPFFFGVRLWLHKRQGPFLCPAYAHTGILRCG